jgi:hypothetical protein
MHEIRFFSSALEIQPFKELHNVIKTGIIRPAMQDEDKNLPEMVACKIKKFFFPFQNSLFLRKEILTFTLHRM